MTFYEAALRVLESAGRPLHFVEITETSISQNLLSHVGKTPEQTMLSRLAAMARRTRDRKVVVTAKDTFALVDWSLPEDAEALAQTGIPEPNPEEALPPYRPAERHPEPRTDNVRAIGRGERKRRRDEEDEGRGRKRRFPPVPEVVFEILSDLQGGLKPEELLERARSRELAGEELSVEQMLTALLEDNQRRIDAGRRPQFLFNKDVGLCELERAGSPSEAPPLELQAAFAAALGIPLEGGRPVLSRGAPSTLEAPDAGLFAAARAAGKDARRAAARALRKRLSECEVGTFEKAVVRMMQALGFRELKVAKRSKEGPLLTARKREGSVELRYAVRLCKGTSAVDRRQVHDLRKDLGHYGAQVGLVISAGDVRGDAKSEAQSSGALTMLWCADALGEKFLEAKAGVSVTQIELFEVDERFFDVARVDAEEAAQRRAERVKERKASEGEDEERPPREPRRAPELISEVPATVAAPEADAAGADDDDDDEEGGEEDDALDAASAFAQGRPEGGAPQAGGAPGAPGERKRRRRRRRGRRGRGPRAEGGAPGVAAPGTDAAAADAAPLAAAPDAPPPPPPAPVAAPESGGQES